MGRQPFLKLAILDAYTIVSSPEAVVGQGASIVLDRQQLRKAMSQKAGKAQKPSGHLTIAVQGERSFHSIQILHHRTHGRVS